jgi:hypothetical protein
VSFCNGKEKSEAGCLLNRRLGCKGIGEACASKALPQDLNLTPLRCMEQHDVAFHKSVIKELLGVLAGDVRYKAWPFKNLFERRALATGHLNGWHGT